MLLKKNQNEVCDEVIRLMSERKNDSLNVVSTPDEIDRENKAVDLHIKGTKDEYYLEHTLIESFPGQLSGGSRFVSLMVPLQEKIRGKIPSGHFSLLVQAGVITGTLDYKKIQAALERWVIEKAGPLSVKAAQSRRYNQYRETPPDVPFEVILGCDCQLKDSFYVGLYVTGDLELKRCERIKSALNDKCPKLQKTKIKNGGSSVLIFESNDIALANHFFIASALSVN